MQQHPQQQEEEKKDRLYLERLETKLDLVGKRMEVLLQAQV